MEISKQSSVYIKYYMNTCMKTDILVKPRKKLSEEVRNLKTANILKNYEFFEGLSTQIFDQFQHVNFCKQTRLFSNVVFMLLKDLIEIYRVYYTHITEILERFPTLGKDDAQKGFIMFQNFVNLTEAIKNKANKLIYIFNFPITLPDFYNPEKGLIDTLKLVVQGAGENGIEDTQDVAKKVRAGMNREQFDKNDEGVNDFFDCKVVENLDENANGMLAIMPNDPSEELRMDKDLGLFEFISKGDFSTVNGGNAQLAAAASSAAAAQDDFEEQKVDNKAQPSTFDFDDFDG